MSTHGDKMTTIKPELGADICRRAIAKWGEERQRDMIIEEASELQKALLKYRRYDRTEEWRIKCVEEAVDMSIMLDQLLMMLSSQQEFDKVRRYKLCRLSKMIDGDMDHQTCENAERDDCCLV